MNNILSTSEDEILRMTMQWSQNYKKDKTIEEYWVSKWGTAMAWKWVGEFWNYSFHVIAIPNTIPWFVQRKAQEIVSGSILT